MTRCKYFRFKKLFGLAASILAAVLFSGVVYGLSRSQETSTDTLEQDDRLIAQEIGSHSQLEQNLRYLAAHMPGRLTGSPRMDAAAAWALQKFQEYGLNASLETVDVPHAWTRGVETAEIISPIRRSIPVHAFGWSKSTGGPVTGKVVALAGKTGPELKRYFGKVKGAVLMVGEPQHLPPGTPENSFIAVKAEEDDLHQLSPEELKEREDALQELISEGPLTVLLDSRKPHNLFNMGNFTNFTPSPIPLAFILHEDYMRLFELSQKSSVSMKIDLEGSFSPEAAHAPFVTAEIAGSSKPAERVLIVAHLDSWDLAEGALDNGVGAMAVLEAARSLHALNLKPDRTLVFLLTSGEEQHHFGIKAYLKKHSAELPNMDGVLVLDGGTGSVINISLGHLEDTEPVFRKIYGPIAAVLHLQGPAKEAYFGSDHDEFLQRGVPSYICVQSPAHYAEAHHSQLDTLKYFDHRGANQAATVLAAWMWNASQTPDKIPRTSTK